MKNEVYLRLIFESPLKRIEEISTLLDISPTYLRNKGDLISDKGTVVYKKNQWIYEIYDKNILHVDELLNQLRDTFVLKENLIKQLSKKYNLVISLICYLKEGTPSITIDKKNISFYERINASFDMDLYCG